VKEGAENQRTEKRRGGCTLKRYAKWAKMKKVKDRIQEKAKKSNATIEYKSGQHK